MGTDLVQSVNLGKALMKKTVLERGQPRRAAEGHQRKRGEEEEGEIQLGRVESEKDRGVLGVER